MKEDVCPKCGRDLKVAPCEPVEIDGQRHMIHKRCNKKKEEEKKDRVPDGPMPL